MKIKLVFEDWKKYTPENGVVSVLLAVNWFMIKQRKNI